jgi:eukaryotic-like serine/threonine-protein kinase
LPPRDTIAADLYAAAAALPYLDQILTRYFVSDAFARLTTALADRYRIDREVGAGGMATVYVAQDVRHDRRVALKVLKPELAAVVGAQRFLSEIKTTANLQHPHILSLFDSGEVNGTVFYVMPFVDGESLRDRLTRESQLPIDAAIRIAREVADALQYAHGHGVIHRDIKPENILLQGGHALVADFGIALAASTTAGARMTETGMSLGTPAYMSPEQAMGERSVDGRTDVYALGCVVYEMLVGEPPFTGPTAQAIVARVLTEEPRSLSAQRKTVPAHVAAATEIALAKLPADRFATPADFAAALSAPSPLTLGSAASGARPAQAGGSTARRALIALGAALALTAGLAAWGWLRAPNVQPVVRSYVTFPETESALLGPASYALLPNGSALIYVGQGPGGAQLWMKKRSELHATQIGGTAGASNVFVSPDGKWIGFVAGEALKKVPVSGGEVTTLATAACSSAACAGGGESGTWLDDGRIAFVSRGTLVAVSENGGALDSIVTSPTISGFAAIHPVALPGSRGVLFTSCTLYCNKSDVMVVDLATRKVRLLAENASRAQYSPTGHLVYVDAQGTGVAIPFDLATLTTHGAPTPIIDRVASGLVLASTGTAAYVEGDTRPTSELVITSRDGRVVQSVDSGWRGNFASLAIAPDGQRIATTIAANGEEHLWVKTIGGGPAARLTFGKTQSTTPTWSADGTSIFFTHFDGTRTSTFVSKRADGNGPEVTVKSGPNWVIESAISRDGSWLVTREYRNGKRDIYARRMVGDTTERVIVATPASDFSPAISPDGKWLAYVSGETGTEQVWVIPFPDAKGAKWQISTDGGLEPVWSNDGRELFYVNPATELVATEVSPSGTFASGRQRVLFSLRGYRRHYTHRAYDVLPDNQHFLMIRNGAPPRGNLVIVENWVGDFAARLRK